MDSDKYHELIPEERCAKCRKIPWRYSEWFENRDSFEIEHHKCWASLEEAAASGCDICRSIRVRKIHDGTNVPEGVPCRLRFSLLHSYLAPEYIIGNWKDARVNLEYMRADGLDITHEPQARIKRTIILQLAKHATLILATGFAPETQQANLDALISERIHPWIEDCVLQRGPHINCKPVFIRGRDDFHLPTRLIDVGNGSSNSSRLIETTELRSTKPKPEYLALSYCWGQSNEPAKTTRMNIQERKKQLKEQEFPKTIQDAIILTRRMGIKYLWVDAICIIQPNKQDQYLTDWTNEAPMMGSYYSNARCLISALSASDSGQGIFAERPAQTYPERNSPIAFDEAQKQTLYLPWDRLVFIKQFDTQPLLTRGWCFQERLLSPRSLHWSTHCLFWQCQSLSQASEQDPDDKLPRRLPWYSSDELQIFQREAEFALTTAWLRAVITYMPTNFTRLTDRLIAIESLGTRLAQIHGVEYFAGVFSSHLAPGLLWRLAGDSGDPGLCAKLSYFPSWSWASSTKSIRVEFEHAQDSSHESLVKIGGKGEVFSPDGSAVDFSTPEKRSLRLEAPLMEITPTDVRTMFLISDRSYSCKFMAKSWGTEVNMIFDVPRHVLEKLGTTKVLILSVAESKVWMYGLIVQPQNGFYERVGYVEFKAPLEPSTGQGKLAELMPRLEQSRQHVILI